MKPGRIGVPALCAGVVLGAALLAAPAQTASVDRHLAADMSGLKEVTAKGKKAAGDKDGRGAGVFDFSGSKMCFGLTVHGIAKPTAAHIHKAGAGKSGPVVVPFGAAYKAKGCAKAASKLIGAIGEHPSAYYVNVHTAKYPNGAIRGNLAPGMHG
jgi:hypothetical protein